MSLPIAEDLAEADMLKCSHRYNLRKHWRKPSSDIKDQCIELYTLMCEKWPQWNIDGPVNSWIVKGDQQKGTKAYMCRNPELLGNAVLQKYVESCLRVVIKGEKHKFSIKQQVLLVDNEAPKVYIFAPGYVTLDNEKSMGLEMCAEHLPKKMSKITKECFNMIRWTMQALTEEFSVQS